MKDLSQLLNKNQFLTTLFSSAPLGMILIDSERRVIAVNDFMKQAFGVSKASLVDANIGKIISCIDEASRPNTCGHSEKCQKCQIMQPAMSALNGKKVSRNRADVQLKVGEKLEDKSLLVTAAPVNYEGENYSIVILEDVTELSNLRRQLREKQSSKNFIGQNPSIIELKEKIRTLADADVPVLIEGESGTGKELVASAIHSEGIRAEKPFVAVNCGAIPETLLESELFGHVKGAFTGAIRDKKGRFEMADGGTIFLDEIGDISPMMQVKLLRVVQEGTFERVGGEKTLKVNVRIISATNKDIKNEISLGKFREDLYYRLCVVPITIPPLRERSDDVPMIAEHILNTTTRAKQEGQPIRISKEAMNVMTQYSWPGNVRELQNAIQFALVHNKNNLIEPDNLPAAVMRIGDKSLYSSKRRRKRKLDTKSVKDALDRTRGNKMKAAELLNVSRATLYRFFDDTDIEI